VQRSALHAVLDAILPDIHVRGQRGILRWSLDIDPQSV
jgi:primosomal protein N'